MANQRAIARGNKKFFPWDTASFGNLLVAFSAFWQVLSFLSNIGIVAIIIYLFDQNVDAYEDPRGVNSYYGNNLAAYGGQPDDGYLPNSNVPKQLLSMGFMSLFYIGILVMLILLAAVDLCLLTEHARGVVRSFRMGGLNLSENSEQQSVIAVAILKLWVGVCVGSQSFVAFGEGNGRPQEFSSLSTWHGRFIVSLFVWAYCLNGLIYIGTTYVLARRVQMKTKKGGKGLFWTHREADEMIRAAESERGLARSKEYGA